MESMLVTTYSCETEEPGLYRRNIWSGEKKKKSLCPVVFRLMSIAVWIAAKATSMNCLPALETKTEFS